MSKKENVRKKREELQKKLRHRIDQLSPKEKEKLRAVALKYDQNTKKAPQIVASGRGKVADKILQIAEENDIPMIEDESLSNLLSKLRIDSEIPPQLFSVVAEVLAFVFHLEKMTKKRTKLRKKFKRIRPK